MILLTPVIQKQKKEAVIPEIFVELELLEELFSKDFTLEKESILYKKDNKRLSIFILKRKRRQKI
ncbi:MAG: hypothetical protein Q7R79_03940 [bacterium]|nr:hypothetical protein [bacterium]